MKQKKISLFISISLFLLYNYAYSQEKKKIIPNTYKPSISLDDYKKWAAVKDAKISNNGKYISYIIEEKKDEPSRIIIESTRKKWSISSTILGTVSFTNDSKKAIWITQNSVLCISALGKKNKIQYIPEVAYYTITEDYLYFKDKINHQIHTSPINNINTHNFRIYQSNTLTELRNEHISLKTDSNGSQSLITINKINNKQKKIWEGRNFSTILRDMNRKQISFTSNENKIWYYRKGMERAIELKPYPDTNFSFSRIIGYSNNGRNLIITLTDQYKRSAAIDSTPVTIWSYLDSKLKDSENKSVSATYVTLLNIDNNQFKKITNSYDWVFFPKYQDSIVLIRSQESPVSPDEMSWNKSGPYKWRLTSLTTLKNIILSNIEQNKIVQLSDNGKYVIYLDYKTNNYYTYNTQTLEYKCITEGIKENWGKNENTNNYGRYIAGWEKNDQAVLIYGEKDIWRIDPSGTLPAVNITNGYGSANNIIFTLALTEYSQRNVKRNELLILSAFNETTKDNGFYGKKNGQKGNPSFLSMGRYIYYIPNVPNLPNGINYVPVKAAKAKKYIVRRMSATESPNYYITSNFKTFKRISNIAPEKRVNWYTSELHEWALSNMKTQKGILYKPEDFNPLIQYPIIFNYYEKKTDGLNAYIKPSDLENGCAINIPYYVSNGYLVFCPDIDYTLGDPMESALNTILTAAKYMSTKQYVNSKKMGIQGCSWGAIQTNYIVTHSDIFAAACSASGLSNWISSYNSMTIGGSNMQGMYENGQFRVGKTLWEDRATYIKNSAVLHADKITAPLLLMHTKGDEICPLTNIAELFSSLHRLGKKSWMLIYDGNHGLHSKEGLDFSIRMKEFFDHFLQDCLSPDWMK